MRITDPQQQAYIELLPHGPQEPDSLSLAFAVRMSAEGFSGRYAEVGIFSGDLRDFIVALERLERERTGHVTLRSMSPDEFTLTVAVIDRAGHVLVTASVRRHIYVFDLLTELAAAVAFAVDPSALAILVSEIRPLLASS